MHNFREDKKEIDECSISYEHKGMRINCYVWVNRCFYSELMEIFHYGPVIIIYAILILCF